MDILFASNNRGKFDELEKDFAVLDINLIFDGNLTLKEDSSLLLENSLEKAISAVEQKNIIALGDDSGLFIEALDYFPGVYSKRWLNTSDHGRNQEILNMMKNEKNRVAYLISRFTLVDLSGSIISKAVVKNKFDISTEEHGMYGFGYDSILVPNYIDLMNYEYYDQEQINKVIIMKQKIKENKLTIGDLTQEEKNLINNRGYIAKNISSDLNKYLLKK